MTDLIESRIKTIKEGKLPEGYKRTKAGIMPVDWDGTIQAKKLFKKHTDKKHDGDLEILAATQERGIVPRSQIGIDIQCSDEGVKGYKKVSKGDFVISLRSFQGGIEYSEYTGIISPAYTVLKPIKDISTGFYRNYFKTDTFIKRLNGAVYGIRDGKQIGYEDFGDMYVHCPPLAEQECITEILTQCDHVIELKEQKLDELKQLKKEFLRKMFPAKGCDTPEIRFPGFTGAWEQRKLGEIAKTTIGEFVIKSKQDDSYPYPVFNGGSSNTGYYKEFNNEGNKILVSARGANAGFVNIIKTRYWAGNSCYSVDLLDKNIFDTDFIFQEMKHKQTKFTDNQQAANIPSVSKSDVEKFIVDVPSYSEQVKIGTYFKNLDSLITLHQRELEETKTYKKTLARLLLTGIVRVKE